MSAHSKRDEDVIDGIYCPTSNKTPKQRIERPLQLREDFCFESTGSVG